MRRRITERRPSPREQVSSGKRGAIYTSADVCMYALARKGCSLGLSPCLAFVMIDVAICLELPARAEHPLKWCIVGRVIYDDGPLWCWAAAYCTGRVWHERPRSEQAWDMRAVWPEPRLSGLCLKSAARHASAVWLSADVVQWKSDGGLTSGRGISERHDDEVELISLENYRLLSVGLNDRKSRSEVIWNCIS